MFVTSLCGPAIIYIGFSLIQIVIDIFKGIYNNAFIKFIIMIILGTVINILCEKGYTIIAWFLVFIPIIMMTIISTLLLRVFGTSPDTHIMRDRIKDISNNLDSSGNYFPGDYTLKQQKQAYLRDNFYIIDRVDRDEIRTNLYNKIDKDYGLKYNEVTKKHRYDLSNNVIKFSIAHRIVNDINNTEFVRRLRQSGLLDFFTNDSYSLTGGSYINGSGSGSGPRHRRPGQLGTSFDPNRDIRLDKMNGTDFESYEKDYNEYLLDGSVLFHESKFDSVKTRLQKTDPDITDAEIDKEIEKMWNNLDATAQNAWNTTAEKNNDRRSTIEYETDNLAARYHSPNIPIYRSDSRRDYEDPCAPGKERNSLGVCVRPCPSGKERTIINGDCR